MTKLLKRKTAFIRILTMVGFILSVTVPVRSWVVAQSEMRYFSSAHAIYTSEFGLESPEEMVYSSDTEAFILWGKDSENEIFLHNEISRKITPPQHVENSLGAAFDQHSNTLFMFDSENAELLQTTIGNSNQPTTRSNIKSLGIQHIQGMTFDPVTGRLFILDAGRPQLFIVSPHSVSGFNNLNAASNKIKRVNLESLSTTMLRGVAFNPNNGHLYVGSPDERKVYELKETGEKVSIYDIGDLHIENPSTMLFAPSQDTTDDPNIVALYILDSGQPTKADANLFSDQRNTSQKGQIVELSLQSPAALPPGTTLLPSTLVRTFDTSNAAWNPSSPDPSGVDYWPASNRLLIVDSEVDEMSNYFQGKNVFLSTTSGALTGTCSTLSFTGEPTGVAINPNNNHVFISTDFNDRIFEVSLGSDGAYCTSDDTVTSTNVYSLYNVTDAEDVAYASNTLFIAGGASAEVYIIPLGANGVLGGGDDGVMTHFDTAAIGFSDLEGIGYNADSGTLFIVSTAASNRYLGETTKTGMLLRAYDLSFMGSAGNIRSDVTYAPGSQNPAIKNIYIVSRGIDNDDNKNENDGKAWEISISNTPVPAQVVVNIGGSNLRSYNILPGGRVSDHYNLSNGPVHVVSTNGKSIFTSERAVYGNSFNSIVGYPGNQLTTDYWFTSYDDVGMTTFLVIGNPSSSQTAQVDVYIGGVKRNTTAYSIPPGGRIFPRYGINGGPVRVLSTNSVPIFTSQRTKFGNSFNEIMGYPANRLTNDYWFTSYDDVGMITYLVIGNPSTSQTAQVDVYIGGVKKNLSSISITPGQRAFLRYGVNSGPVRVVSTNGVSIFASERTKFGNTFNEVMGYPANRLTTDYWFTSYDDTSMITYLVIGNPSSQTAQVDVYISGVKKNATSISIPPGQRTFLRYGVNSGPVRVVSTNGVSIFASERSKYQNSFNEILGLAGNQLTTDYWFTSYDDVGMSTFLVIGTP